MNETYWDCFLWEWTWGRFDFWITLERDSRLGRFLERHGAGADS